jgi:membrane protein
MSSTPSSESGSNAGRTKQRAAAVQARLVAARPRIAALDAGLRVYERDRRFGGSLLAGGLSFRLFVLLLPVSLLMATAMGFLADSAPQAPTQIARRYGLSAASVSFVSRAARDSERGRWVLMVVALVLMLYASSGALRAIRTVHAVVWGIQPGRVERPVIAVFAFSGIVLAGIVTASVISALSSRSILLGLVGIVVSAPILFLGWLWASWRLPHRDVPVSSLMPGAALFAIGIELLHVATVYYLTRKLTSASELYGALGSAAVVLLWLYLIGRLVVAAASLNVALWEVARGRQP